MVSLSDWALILLIVLAIPVGFALFILPSAILLKRSEPALSRAGEPGLSRAGFPVLSLRAVTRAEVQKVCKQTAWLVFLFAGAWALEVALGTRDLALLVDAGVLLLSGIGMRRCSRIAAVVALAVFALNVTLSARGSVFFSLFSLIYIVGISYGVYAAFRYHRIPGNGLHGKAAAQQAAEADGRTR